MTAALGVLHNHLSNRMRLFCTGLWCVNNGLGLPHSSKGGDDLDGHGEPEYFDINACEKWHWLRLFD